MSKPDTPYVAAGTVLPEITFKAIILGIVLSAVLAGANAYLGLFAGMTVSASIPAAVISMAIFRLFRESNILENNIVQTAASAGESLAAGVIFTFPALILMGYWSAFNYWETMLIALCGGVLGVMFTIPLRSALIVKQRLQFPEGIATSEVLKSGEEGGKSVKYLLYAGLTSGLFKFAESGLGLWHGILDKAALVQSKAYLYFGMNLSPALVAVGYIVGLRIAVLVFIGGAISWWVAIPAYIAINGAPEATSAVDMGYSLWSTKIRYLGVGAMVVGGLWALVSIRGSLGGALKQGFSAFRSGAGQAGQRLRTEFDTPISWVIIGIGVMIIPIVFIYFREIETFGISAFMAIIMVVFGFLFSAVAGYMAGLVGSSNNPISGVTIATILFSSLMLLMLMGSAVGSQGAAAAILIGAVVCCAAAIAGDNMQDLKAGHVLGATPYKQQIMQMIGVIAAAVAIPLVLDLLNAAYGFGPKTAENPDALAAPQATLMQSVAEGVFIGNLPWTIISIGMGMGVVIIVIDRLLAASGSSFRVPVLAVAVGLYLPFELDSAIMFGGLIAFAVERFHLRQSKLDKKFDHEARLTSARAGLLFASGLITGEALIGILMAIPIAYFGRNDVFAIVPEPLGTWPGLLLLLAVAAWLYFTARNAYKA